MFTFGRRQFQKSSLEAHRNRLHTVTGASPGQQNWPLTPPRGSSITAGHSGFASTPELGHNVFTNFLRFCSERSLAVARTPLTVREQTGRSDRSPLALYSSVGTARTVHDQPGCERLGCRGRAGRAEGRGRQRRPFQMERRGWSGAGLGSASDWAARVARQGGCAAIFKRRGMMRATELAFSATSATFSSSLGRFYEPTVVFAALKGPPLSRSESELSGPYPFGSRANVPGAQEPF